MQNPSEARERRSQRDYSLPFKLAVVGEVGRGELIYKQAQRRYGRAPGPARGPDRAVAWRPERDAHRRAYPGWIGGTAPCQRGRGRGGLHDLSRPGAGAHAAARRRDGAR